MAEFKAIIFLKKLRLKFLDNLFKYFIGSPLSFSSFVSSSELFLKKSPDCLLNWSSEDKNIF